MSRLAFSAIIRFWTTLKNSRNSSEHQATPSSAFASLKALTGMLLNSLFRLGSNVGGMFLTQVRTNVRNHFPRAREVKRVRVHGWDKRMSTRNGRKIIMRRILKGCHVLSH